MTPHASHWKSARRARSWRRSGALGRIRRNLCALHRNESGTISIVSVFAIFMFTILLAMVTNVAKHVDDKIRMQNAADASAYTGAVVMARGMNALAFTNHLLCEVFALTAYMREGYDRDDGASSSDATQNVESLAAEVLDVWEEIGPIFQQHGAQSGYTKFANLGSAITEKIPHERALVEAWGKMTYYHAELTLPVLEYVLSAGSPSAEGGLIPRFQREVVLRTPAMAQLAAAEVAARNGASTEHTHSDRTMEALLWRCDVRLVDDGVDQTSVAERSLPAVDPSPLPFGDDLANVRGGQAAYADHAVRRRRAWARRYLEDWINDWMGPYFGYDSPTRFGRTTAKMSQYRNLWLMATRSRLEELLTLEYPDTNLPHVLRYWILPIDNQRLDDEYHFVGVTYWRHVDETFPGLFVNRIFRDGNADSLAFAQAAVYLPIPRYVWPWARYRGTNPITGQAIWDDIFESVPTAWVTPDPRQDSGLFSENWSVKLVPAEVATLPDILRIPPPGQAGYRVPNLGNATIEDIRTVSHH